MKQNVCFYNYSTNVTGKNLYFRINQKLSFLIKTYINSSKMSSKLDIELASSSREWA